MMIKRKLLSSLGLAMQAGKLITGDENVLTAIRAGTALLVLIADDASEKTQKKFQDKCSHYAVPIWACCNRNDLGQSIGKPERVVLAVTDSGFAQMIAKCQVKPAEVE